MHHAIGTVRATDTRNRRAPALDLIIVIAWFLVCYATEPALDPILRRGHGLKMVFALAAYQFSFEGLAPLVLMAIHRERFSQYGFARRNAAKSLMMAIGLAVLYNLGMSLHAGAILWIPLRRHSAVRMSLSAGFPPSVIGLAVTVAVWGFLEGFFGIFFAKKLNQALGHAGRGWLSPGALGFALFNGLIHMTASQGLEGFVTSFASGYAIAVIPAVMGNAWGGTLVQTLTNSVGKS